MTDDEVEVEELLLDNDLDGAGYFTGDNYATAIIGYTEDQRVVYSYDKMIDWYVNKYKDDGVTETDAVEWIDYNVIGPLPYMENAPIIVYDLMR